MTELRASALFSAGAVPIGTILELLTDGRPSLDGERYLLANGQTASVDDYPELASYFIQNTISYTPPLNTVRAWFLTKNNLPAGWYWDGNYSNDFYEFDANMVSGFTAAAPDGIYSVNLLGYLDSDMTNGIGGKCRTNSNTRDAAVVGSHYSANFYSNFKDTDDRIIQAIAFSPNIGVHIFYYASNIGRRYQYTGSIIPANCNTGAIKIVNLSDYSEQVYCAKGHNASIYAMTNKGRFVKWTTEEQDAYTEIATGISSTLRSTNTKLVKGPNNDWILYNGTSYQKSTDDGVTWSDLATWPELVSLGTPSAFTHYQGGVYTSWIGTNVITSTDGLTWSVVDVSGIMSAIYGIIVVSGLLYILPGSAATTVVTRNPSTTDFNMPTLTSQYTGGNVYVKAR